MECWEPTTRTSASSSRRDLKQSHSTQTKRKAIANIQQPCSDSPAIANPMDGVFGTDRYPLHRCGDVVKLSLDYVLTVASCERYQPHRRRGGLDDRLILRCGTRYSN